jgi:hypothetical protein
MVAPVWVMPRAPVAPVFAGMSTPLTEESAYGYPRPVFNYAFWRLLPS